MKRLAVAAVILVCVSCGPKRLGCGPRRCSVEPGKTELPRMAGKDVIADACSAVKRKSEALLSFA